MPVIQERDVAPQAVPKAALTVPESRSATYALKAKLNRMRQKANKAREKAKGLRAHREKVLPPGTASPEYFALVHTPISIKEAMKI